MSRHDGPLRLADWFCGAGGSTQGIATIPGVQPVHAANHWARAIESHAANFPDVDHWKGDIKDLDVSRLPYAELFWASPECFPAETLVLTSRGLAPISEVRIGDEVLTHRRRWRHVTAIMSKFADTITVSGVGLGKGIETTAEHPFLTREITRSWDTESRRSVHAADDAQWTAAKDLSGSVAWATPVEFAGIDGQPPIPKLRKIRMDLNFWWMVGRWLGDGSMRLKDRDEAPLTPRRRAASRPAGSPCIMCGQPARPARTGARFSDALASPYCSTRCKAKNARKGARGRYELTIVCGFHEADDLAPRLAQVSGLTWARRDLRTAAAFTASGREIVEWLNEHFGQHAAGKTIPAWALGMLPDSRRALLDGYLSADGHQDATGWQATTVSKRLALGVRMLANSLGLPANMNGPYLRRPHTIEGRAITQRPAWSVQWRTTGHYQRTFSAVIDGIRWLPVREVAEGRRDVQVFNLSVDEDESYVADGIIVHNCTNWSRAKGRQQDYANADVALPGMEEPAPAEEVERSRALMEEVPLYLEAMVLRGRPVLAGVVENVIDIRDWTDWGRWRAQIEGLGYRTRLIALNSMHAQSVRTARAPQSRDRLYLAYWHESLRRDPDWDKWLRPTAWCPTCEEWVAAVQVFKDPKRDMGRYRSQYVYRCPQASCRGQIVEPEFSPAYTAIDWTVKGERIGDKPLREFFADKAKTQSLGLHPLAPKTLARIAAGIKKFARPITLEATGNTFERRPGVRTWPFDAPLTTQTTSQTKAIAVPPLLVPVEGRDGKQPSTINRPMRTQSTRSETALVTVPLLVPAGGTWNDTAAPVTDPMRTRSTRENEALVVAPFIAELRGGHSFARPLAEALSTFAAGGNHHGLVVPPGMMMRNNGSKGDGGEHCTALDDAMRTLTTTGHQSLVTWGWEEWASLYAYDSGEVRSVLRELPTQTTVEGDALLHGAGLPAVEDCLFRMLEPHEILAGMAFAADYIVLGNRRERVRQAGNAVTPPAAEVIVSALVECITGEDVAA